MKVIDLLSSEIFTHLVAQRRSKGKEDDGAVHHHDPHHPIRAVESDFRKSNKSRIPKSF